MLRKYKEKYIINELTRKITINNKTRLVFPFPVVGGHVIIHELVAQYANYLLE